MSSEFQSAGKRSNPQVSDNQPPEKLFSDQFDDDEFDDLDDDEDEDEGNTLSEDEPSEESGEEEMSESLRSPADIVSSPAESNLPAPKQPARELKSQSNNLRSFVRTFTSSDSSHSQQQEKRRPAIVENPRGEFVEEKVDNSLK